MDEIFPSSVLKEANSFALKVVQDPVYLALLTIAISTLLIVVLFVIGRKSGKRHAILILGSCESGKTAMFIKLTRQPSKMTFTSMRENKGNYFSDGKKDEKNFLLVDIPGHDRIRNKFIEENKDSARAIIFVVDSGNFTRQLRDAAELMYDILADRSLAKARIPILVACNKQDLPTAKSCQVMQSQLEKELNILRTTRAAALRSTDESGSSHNNFIGKQNKDFKFADVAPVQVSFVECNVVEDGEDCKRLRDVEKWLKELK